MSSEKSPFKAFLLGTAKIGLAIFVSIIALAIVGISIGFIYKYIESTKNKPLAVIKSWPQINIPALKNAKFNLTTKWEDSIVHYKFSMYDYPAEKEGLPIPKFSPFYSKDGAFTITFLDETGFKVKDREMKINKLARIINDHGDFIGLNLNDSFYMSAEDYRKIRYWEITWYF
jgi:hypothetical protein